jgi:hypothetical protein
MQCAQVEPHLDAVLNEKIRLEAGMRGAVAVQ